jgi:hypothetical protein
MNTAPELTNAQIELAKAFGVFVVTRDDGWGNRYCASVLGIGDCFYIHANIGVEGTCELVMGTVCDLPDCGMPATHNDDNDDYDLCDEHYELFLEEDEEKTEAA